MLRGGGGGRGVTLISRQHYIKSCPDRFHPIDINMFHSILLRFHVSPALPSPPPTPSPPSANFPPLLSRLPPHEGEGARERGGGRSELDEPGSSIRSKSVFAIGWRGMKLLEHSRRGICQLKPCLPCASVRDLIIPCSFQVCFNGTELVEALCEMT